MNEERHSIQSWRGLSVGDRVRQVGGSWARKDTFVIVELRYAPSPLSGEADALALIRDANDATYLVAVGQIRRI